LQNPTAKRKLKITLQTHRQHTQNNTPGAVPTITRIEHVIQNVVHTHNTTEPILTATMMRTKPPGIAFTCNTSHNIISRHAINALTTQERFTPNDAFTQKKMNPHPSTLPSNINHYANPMVHPVTGDIVSSYKKAMNDTSIGELWKTAFGKEFRGLAQGDINTQTKGTNAIFIMTHKDIKACKGKYIYTCVCLDHRPQKEDPYRIWITAGGNLIKYAGELLVQTADITMSKLLWNSVVSTDKAK